MGAETDEKHLKCLLSRKHVATVTSAEIVKMSGSLGQDKSPNIFAD